MLKCCMSFPFCASEPLVCRVGGTSRTALLIHQCALQLEQWVHAHQEISTKLLTHLCLLRPWSSALLGQDFKSRKQESLQADQLGHRALLVLLWVCPFCPHTPRLAELGPRSPNHLPFAPAGLSAMEKIIVPQLWFLMCKWTLDKLEKFASSKGDLCNELHFETK